MTYAITVDFPSKHNNADAGQVALLVFPVTTIETASNETGRKIFRVGREDGTVVTAPVLISDEAYTDIVAEAIKDKLSSFVDISR